MASCAPYGPLWALQAYSGGAHKELMMKTQGKTKEVIQKETSILLLSEKI